jgi:N utilization substance protein B
MSSRRRAREFALSVLFQADVGKLEIRDALDALWGGLLEETESDLGSRPPESEEIEFATALSQGVAQHQTEIDERIETSSTNWRIGRMAAVDRNILRLGTFELVHQPHTPPHVVINEAVELAKRFGTQDSKAFVNGILDRIGRDLGRIGGR